MNRQEWLSKVPDIIRWAWAYSMAGATFGIIAFIVVVAERLSN